MNIIFEEAIKQVIGQHHQKATFNKERFRHLGLLKKNGYHCIFCYFFQSRVHACIARNHLRGTTVPDKVIAATSNQMDLPSMSEGFTDMIYVRVKPPHFQTSPYHEKHYEIRRFGRQDARL